MAKIIITKEELNRIITNTSALMKECEGVTWGPVYWHEADAEGINWGINHVRCINCQPCIDIMNIKIRELRLFYNIHDEA